MMRCKKLRGISKEIYTILTILLIMILSGCSYNVSASEKKQETSMNLEQFPEYNLAVEYSNAQNYGDAIIHYKRALDNPEIKQRGVAEYWIKGMIGECYTLQGEYEEAEPYILEAIAGIETSNDSYLLSMIYETAGEYYLGVSQYNRALESYDNSLKYAQGAEIVRANWGKARAYTFLGEKQEALKYYNIAISEGEKQQDSGSLVNVYLTLGTYWMNEGNLKEAKDCFEKEVEYAEKNWGINDIKVADAYRHLARTCSLEKDYNTAYSYSRKAMDIYNVQENKEVYVKQIASLYNNMGSYNMDLEDYSASLDMLKKSYDIASVKMEENEELLVFYKNVLSINIKALYEKTADDIVDYETWFAENFEN